MEEKMKFSAGRGELLSALQTVLSIVPTRTTLQVLSNVLLEVDNVKGVGKLRLAATDLDTFVLKTIPVNVLKNGEITIPAKVFADIIREAPETEIEVGASDTRVEIKFGKGIYRISGITPDDFPKLPEINLAKQIKINGAELSRMIRKTIFGVSSDETRAALNGILWRTKGDKMEMVATDGHRLAKISLANKKLKGMHEDVIIPPKVLNLLVRFIGDEENEVGIIFGENNIVFSLGDIVLSSRLIEGPYPNFEQVIPKESDKKLFADIQTLTNTVKRVAILSNTLTHQVKLGLKKGKGKEGGNIELSSVNFDLGGEAQESIPCEYVGEDMEVGYNANYMLDILKQMEGDKVTLELSNPVSAGIIYSTPQPEGEEYLCLLMPLRLVE